MVFSHPGSGRDFLWRFFVTGFHRETTPFTERPNRGGNETQHVTKEFIMRKQILSRSKPMVPSMILALILVGLIALPAIAGPRGGGFRFLRHLDLSEQQQVQAREVMENYRTDMQIRMNQLRGARQALREIIHGETFDEAAVRQAHAKVAAESAELAVLRAKAFADIRPILTPEQLETLQDLPARGSGMNRGKGKGRGMGKGQGMGNGPAWDGGFDSDLL
jgi:Spy/CpxP family protein refolding chaperone